jgi:hypothetical protein
MFVVFSIDDRDRLRDQLLDMASADARVVGGAVLGSLAYGEGDRWSDLDIMFAVADDVAVIEVLEAFSATVIQDLDAVQLFDLVSGPITYRVFLLPGSLELDLSFASASQFGAGGPNFTLLFGEAVEQPSTSPTSARELFGYAVHHTLHARVAIERGRFWLAEYWISAVRDYALNLACLRRGLDGWYGRDFDKLPAEVLEPFDDGLVRSLEPGELRRALRHVVEALLDESVDAQDMADKVKDQLRELVSDPDSG